MRRSFFGFIGAVDYGRAVFTAMEVSLGGYAAASGYNATAMTTAAENASTLSISASTITPSQYYACVTGTGASAVIGTHQASSFTCPDGVTTSGHYAQMQITSNFAAIFNSDQASVPTITATVRIS